MFNQTRPVIYYHVGKHVLLSIKDVCLPPLPRCPALTQSIVSSVDGLNFGLWSLGTCKTCHVSASVNYKKLFHSVGINYLACAQLPIDPHTHCGWYVQYVSRSHSSGRIVCLLGCVYSVVTTWSLHLSTDHVVDISTRTVHYDYTVHTSCCSLGPPSKSGP
jgi:hypothetical protein